MIPPHRRACGAAAALLAGLALGACTAPAPAPISAPTVPPVSSSTAATPTGTAAPSPATTAEATTEPGGPALPRGRLVTATPAPPPAPAPSPAAASPAAPRPAAPAPAAPPPVPPPAPPATPATAAPVALPWPTAGAADATSLQSTTDGGGQPWLLDPSEVALAYAAAAHGWTDAQAYPGPGGTSVDVRNPAGDQITLTLAQPARKGDGGIWVVVQEQPA